ncbi:hypothetical protein TIFTF001_054063 [Ficus carica]|uniref:Uncharacterized protein n=1 Tax=Ficus carica TaxID=3494 RepID=A0AA88EAT0_FICCA|nr:hypothetical protein TIFTF001_054060 [Ficus carica]GMN71249.1 hypothetical protein TIFTF001_054061 [Ficus carica]GMN71252.1 hypothetical protein TIFTF001_054062 [Ficus carica]GMN71259.1 hypothetical protein TIFTF001_054063 [Ficus carica]
MSSGDGEISAHKISLKGLATGWTHAKQLAGQGAGNMGDDRGPRFVWPGVGPKLTSGLISRKQRDRDPLGCARAWAAVWAGFTGLGWQWIRRPELAHVD